MSLCDSKEPRKCKAFSGVSFLLLLSLLQLQVATAAANGVVKVQTFRAVSSYSSTVASCYKQGVYPNLSVSWKKDGRHIDVAADKRFSSNVRIRSGSSTHFYLDFNPALSSDNNTVITCQPEGEKESESAPLIVYDAPLVEAIGDSVVTLQENSLFRSKVRIDFQGGRLNLMYSKNGKDFQQTPVDGVHGTKDVLLPPIRVDAKMNGPLSIVADIDGLRFIYNIYRLIVVNQTATATSSPPLSLPYGPTTKSIGNSGSNDSSSSAKNTTPAMTLSPPSSTSTSPSPMSTSARPSDASNKDNSSLVPFTSGSLDGNSKSSIIAVSVSGVLVLVILVTIYVKSRDETSTSRDCPEGVLKTSPRRQPENAPRDSAYYLGLAQCEGNSTADSKQRQENNRYEVVDLEHSQCQGGSVEGSVQLEANSCVINERDGGGVPTQAADTVVLEIQAVRDEILHEVQKQGNKTRALMNQQRPRPPEREKECAETMV